MDKKPTSHPCRTCDDNPKYCKGCVWAEENIVCHNIDCTYECEGRCCAGIDCESCYARIED